MENGKDWIDFNLVKQSVSMEMLIIHFGITQLSRREDEVRLKCPFHQGKSGNSLSVNLAKNTFYCFGCKARGNVLDFVAKSEKCSVKDAALKLNEWFGIEPESVAQTSERESATTSSKESHAQQISPAQIIANIETELALLKQLLGAAPR
jgi:DNA primase